MVIRLIICVLIVGILIGCGQPNLPDEDRIVWKDNDDMPIVEPSFDEPSLAWTSYKRTFLDQVMELLDIDRNVRKITGNPTEAKNVNSIDEVPNSSWFTNRHGYPTTRMTPAEIEKGYTVTNGPALSGSWQVFRPKKGGATPGFWIEDAQGDQYIIKFDPVGYPEMSTAAAAMGSRYFYACGYNTPQETIVYWHPDMLTIREGATYKDHNGKKQPLTLKYIDNMLEQVEREPDGRIRSLASLNLGNVKGPFLYDGTKKDDPNDWCPHEHRRELRGLAVIGALVNHYDLKDHNSMDVYIGEKDKGYLKHYLMDFGSTFGSDGKGNKIPRKGYANMFDLRDVLVSTATLGIKSWAWEYAEPIKHQSIGYFEAELFEPENFDPIVPNPAFEQMTHRDAYWGAKVVMSFTDDDLKAIVKAGKYSDPLASEYLLQTLQKRRDKIGRHWFSKVSPLDYFYAEKTDSGLTIHFDDLAVAYGLDSTATYESTLNLFIKDITKMHTLPSVSFDWNELGYIKNNTIELLVEVKRNSGDWLPPVKVQFQYSSESKEAELRIIEH